MKKFFGKILSFTLSALVLLGGAACSSEKNEASQIADGNGNTALQIASTSLSVDTSSSEDSATPDLEVEAVKTESVAGTFTANPAVLEMGDGYAVVWATSFTGSGYIKYSYQGTEYTVYDESNGYVRTDDNIHVVKVPHEHLNNNVYSVYSQEVSSRTAYGAQLGETVSYTNIAMRAYNGQTELEILVLTDVHEELALAAQVKAHLSESPDLIVFPGDIYDYFDTKEDIVGAFNIMGTISGGNCPVVYARGNHETRGAASALFSDYFPSETGGLYYSFDYGNLSAVVLDTGEDKPDDRSVLGGVVDFKNYRQQELEWLSNVELNESAKYRLAIYHIPDLENDPSASGVLFNEHLENLGVQFGISGHLHDQTLYTSAVEGYGLVDFPVLISGGRASASEYVGSLITLNGDQMTIRSVNDDGEEVLKECSGETDADGNLVRETVGSKSLTLDLDKPVVGNTPYEAQNLPAYHMSSWTVPFGAPSISITAEPTVFESGGDYYNIVWATDIPGAGYVTYQYDGTTYNVYDQAMGMRRVHDTVHTVRVPKAHLNGNSYTVSAFNMITYEAYEHVRGNSVSKSYTFNAIDTDGEVEVITASNVKSGSDPQPLAYLSQTVEALGGDPALVIMNGNVADRVESKEQFVAFFLSATFAASKGRVPVVFARGNNECRGEFAANIARYLPTATGKSYYTFNYGAYTGIVLDVAANKTDDHWQFYGLADFERTLREQGEWLASLDISAASSVIAIANQPLESVVNGLGEKWGALLEAQNVKTFISGGESGVSVTENYLSGALLVNVGGTDKGYGIPLSAAYAKLTLTENSVSVASATKTSSGIATDSAQYAL